MTFQPPLQASIEGLNSIQLVWPRTSPEVGRFIIEHRPAILRRDNTKFEWGDWETLAIATLNSTPFAQGNGEVSVRETGEYFRAVLTGYGYGWLYSWRIRQSTAEGLDLTPEEELSTEAHAITRSVTPIVLARVTYVRSRKAYVTIRRQDWHLFNDPPLDQGDFLPWQVTFYEPFSGRRRAVLTSLDAPDSLATPIEKGVYSSPVAPVASANQEEGVTWFHWEVFSADTEENGFNLVTGVEIVYGTNWNNNNDPTVDKTDWLQQDLQPVSLPSAFGGRFEEDLTIGQFFKTSTTGRSVVELYQFENLATQQMLRVCNERLGVDIVFDDSLYVGTEMEVEGFAHKGEGTLPRPVLRFKLPALAHQLITLSSDEADFFMAREQEKIKVTRIRTLVRFLDVRNWGGIDNLPGGWSPNPSKRFPDEIFYVDRISRLDQSVLEVELAAAMDLEGVSLPKRMCLSKLCSWEYRGTECGYTGELLSCNKTLADCQRHFPYTALPYGGFPALGNIQ